MSVHTNPSAVHAELKTRMDEHLSVAAKGFVKDAMANPLAPATKDEIIETLLTRFSEKQLKDMGLGEFIAPYFTAKREQANAQIESAIREEIGIRYSWLKPQEDGTFTCELFANYDDSISPESLQKICASCDPYLAFREHLERIYEDVETKEREELVQAVLDSIEDADLCEDIEDEIWEKTTEIIFWEPPEDHYLKQEVCVDIQVDTGTGCCGFYEIMNDGTLDPQAGLLWLAKQQGYTEADIQRFLHGETARAPESALLRSVKREVEEATYRDNILTFLVKMTVRQLIDLAAAVKLQERNGKFYDATKIPDCGTITLSASTWCGLYNPWNGSGGSLDLELEKDVVLPIRYIHDLVLEHNGRGDYGKYLIMDAYGMCAIAWKNTVVAIEPIDLEGGADK